MGMWPSLAKYGRPRERMKTLHRNPTTLVLLVGLALGSCSEDKKPESDAKTGAEATPAGEAKPKGDAPADEDAAQAESKKAAATPAAPAGDLAAVAPASSVQTHKMLEHSGAVAHVVFKNPTSLVDNVREKLVPSAYQAFVKIDMAKASAAGMFEGSGKLVENVRLDQPVGCVLVDSDVVEYPVACIVGYTGGASTFATDLGTFGKQDDAKGHTAHFQFGGQDLFIDELGEFVAVTNHEKLLEQSKSYLTTNLIERAPTLSTELELVAYPAVALKRFEKELEPLFETMASGPTLPGAFGDMMAEFQGISAKHNRELYQEMEELLVGIGFDSSGMMLDFEAFPAEGSGLQTRFKKTFAGPLEHEAMGRLPAASWAVVGGRNESTYFEDPAGQAVVAAFVKAYVDLTGNDRATIDTALDTHIKRMLDTYGPQSAVSILALPETSGGLVIETELETDKSDSEGWKTRSQEFTPEAVLGAEGAKKVTWAFSDGGTYEGVSIDRWTIEPTKEAHDELAKDEDYKKAVEMLGGESLVIERCEHNGIAIFTAAIGKAEPFTQAAIDALNGKGALKEDAAFKAFSAANAGVTTAAMINAQGALEWLKSIVPEEDQGDLPPAVGVDLSDVVMAGAVSEQDGSTSTTMRISQGFIDKLRDLAQ